MGQGDRVEVLLHFGLREGGVIILIFVEDLCSFAASIKKY